MGEENKEETALSAPVTTEQLAALGNNKYDAAVLDTVAKSGDYISRVQLYSGSNQATKEGKIGMGHYGYVDGDNLVDLGKEVDVLLLAWRPMAMDVNGKVPVKVFDKDSALFKELMHKADNVPQSGCAYGADCLIYIPKIKKFATLYFGSKSNRKQIKNFITLMNKRATLSAEFVKTEKYSWHVINTCECTAPFEMPTLEEILKRKKQFEDEASAKAPEAAAPADDRR